MNTGCELYHDCFTCPFPDCIITKLKSPERYLRKARALKLLASGKSIELIASDLKVSKRTVQRYLGG